MPEMPGRILNPEMPTLQGGPMDVIPPQDRNDITTIDEQALVSYLIQQFQSTIKDKEEFGWIAKRKHDIDAYYQIKQEALRHWPWEGASNSRVPMTPTLLDTAHANIKASIWSDAGDPVKVWGVGVEDIRKAPILENYLNWKVNNEIDMEAPMDSNIFRTFLHGTGIMKIIRNLKNQILLSSVDIENIYVPIDASGFKIEQCDFVTQIIGLTYNDLQLRKPFYKDVDKIAPGIGIATSLSQEQLTMARDVAHGTSMDQRMRRDLYFIAETYCTYYPKDSMKAKELIVWWSPNGGTIHRLRENKEGIRPYSRYAAYENPGRFYAMSLPEKIKGLQDDIDYANKQNTDAIDRAIAPAMFVDDTSGFEKNRAQRVPGGIYQKGRSQIEYEPVPPVERGFERKMQELWFQAEQVLGLIDVTVGGQTRSGRTLGETQIRTTRADIRFGAVFSRFEKGWKDTVEIIYEYCNRYEDRSKKLKVLGYTDIKSLEELFPTSDPMKFGLAVEGKFDFGFGGSPINEREMEKQSAVEFALDMMAQPRVQQNDADWWRCAKILAEARGQRNLEAIISRPKSVDIYSPQEFIQRVMSGQYDLQIRPGIDADGYLFELELFMRSESFSELDPRGQKALNDAKRRVFMMSVAERQALLDTQMVMGRQQAEMAMQGQASTQQPPEPMQ